MGNFNYISVQFSSVVSDSATPWTAAQQASLSITNSWSLLKLMSIESVMLSNHLILCRLQSCPGLYATTHKKTEFSLSSCLFLPLAESISLGR